MTRVKSTMINGYELKDRWDGVEINYLFKDDSNRKVNVSDAQILLLIADLQSIVREKNRPVSNREREFHV